MFTADLIHRFTPRTTIKVAEFFSATPENLLNPIAVQRVALPVGSTGTIGNNFETRLEVRKSELTAFEFKVADSRRIYDAREFVDSVHDSVGVELRNRLSPHNTLRTGYEYGIFSFQDGHAPTLAPVPPPPPPPPAPLPGPTPTAAGALSVTGLGSARHRPYVGYLFDRGRGLHLDLRVGQDMLSFDDSSLQKTSSPFVDSAVGWIWSRARFIVGYGMGIEEGGGVFTNARSRRGRADIGFRITDALSLLLTGGHEIRDSLEEATPTTTGTLKTTLAGSSLVYVLSRKWAFDLTFTRYSQTSEGLADRIPDITTNRFLLGATYAFGRRNVKTPFAREDEVIEEEEPEVPVPETPETP
jgi:hypothetical protein